MSAFIRSRYSNRAVTYSNRTVISLLKASSIYSHTYSDRIAMSILKATSIYMLNFIHNNTVLLSKMQFQSFKNPNFPWGPCIIIFFTFKTSTWLPYSLACIILYHLYHQGLSVPAFCTFYSRVLGPISHT